MIKNRTRSGEKNKKYDLVIIGHISKDFNIDHLDNEVANYGGAAIYSSVSAIALGHKVLAVTKISSEDILTLSAFVIPKEDVRAIESESSCSIRNKYFTPDKVRRDCTCLSVGTPFEISDIPTDVESVCRSYYSLTLNLKSVPLTLALFDGIACVMSAVNNVITTIVPLYSRDKIDSGLMAGLLYTFCYIGSTLATSMLGRIADTKGWNDVFVCILIFTIISLIVCCASVIIKNWNKT